MKLYGDTLYKDSLYNKIKLVRKETSDTIQSGTSEISNSPKFKVASDALQAGVNENAEIDKLATIPKDRLITAQLFVGRPDGTTYKEITDWLVNAEVELGDVSSVGTGNTGADAVVRTCRFTLQNDENNDFSPRNRNSHLNQFDVDGDAAKEYAPLLYPMREIVLRVAIEGDQESGTTSKIEEEIGTGDASKTSFSFDEKYILIGSESIYLNNHPSDINYTTDYDEGIITFDTAPADGVEITASYTYFHDLFSGYLGDNISDEGQTISCEARDYAKLLQQTYIETERVYGAEDGSVLAEDVIREILNDNGLSDVNLYVPESTNFAIKPYKLQYKSVWDAIQKIVNQFGWFCGYLWDDADNEFQLKLIEPPRNKTKGDYKLDYQTDFYKQDLDLSDANIRNFIRIDYRDQDTGKKEVINVFDNDSIDAFGKRSMQIEEDSSSQIDTSAEATDMADAALKDLKDLPVKSNIDMPLLPQISLFDGLDVVNENISNTTDFFGVNNIRHTLDFAGGSIRTEIQGEGKVIGGKTRWLKMQTRPGASEPISPEKTIGGSEILSPPANVTINSIQSGFEVKFDEPNNNANRWVESKVYVSDTSGFNPSDANLLKRGKATFFSISKGIKAGETYYVQVSHIDVEGEETAPSAEISVTAGGATTSSTLTIAAFDSTGKGKAGADYVCDGTSDQEQINAALSDLGSDKGEVTLLEGDYYIDASISDDGKHTLSGKRANIIVDSSVSSSMKAFILGNNFKLKGVEINCQSTHSGISGVNVVGSNVSVSDIEIDGFTEHCLTASGGIENIKINNSSFKESGFSSVNLGGTVTTLKNTRFVNNFISNPSSSGLRLISSDNLIISNNIFYENYSSGVYADADMKNSKIENNTIAYSGLEGINMSSNSGGNSIKNNTVVGSSQNEDNDRANILIATNNNDIQGNTCKIGDRTNGPKYGIRIVTADNNIVANNDLYNSGKTANFLDDGTNTVLLGGNRT